MLTTTTQCTGVLFPIDEEKLRDGGPRFLGHISLGDKKVSLSAFLKDTLDGSGKQYLELSLGERNEVHYSGRLFRNERRGPKSPDYSGHFTLLELTPGVRNQYTTEDWKSGVRLTVFGRRVRGQDGKVRIALDILPARNTAPVSDAEVVF